MVTRRELLLGSTALAANLLIAASPGRARGGAVVPRLSRGRIIRRVVGLRPYRPAGFDLGVETVAGKTVLHNYGHGGGGITLSWGTARLVVERIGELGLEGPVAVLGAGAVGLATARLLQERGLPVSLHAGLFSPQLTSSVAPASWYPSLVAQEDLRTPVFLEQLLRTLRYSHRRFEALIGRRMGVFRRDHYVLAQAPPETAWGSELVPDLLPPPVDVSGEDLPFRSAYVGWTRRLFIETQTYLPALLRLIRRDGARLMRREFERVEELASLPEAVVVNCTGMGSAGLFGKRDLVPVRGQLTGMRPDPRITYTLSAGELYLHPRADALLLGGTHGFGDASPSFDPQAEERILAGMAALFGPRSSTPA
jgi:glycine/D-amino acid oxidase-like deaminating enzyme